MKRGLLKRLLPVDPDYAPFGWRGLRGMNALSFLIFAPIALSRGLADLKTTVSFRDGKSLEAAFIEAMSRLPANLFIALTTVTVLMVAAMAALNASEGRPTRWRIVALELALIAAATIARPISWQMSIGLELRDNAFTWMNAVHARYVLENLLFGNLAVAPIYLRRRRETAVRALREAKLRRVNAQRQATEARLQSLQAQIEPHFLFNTLAHILRLHQIDPQRGRAMLRSLAEYMRSALPQIREPDFTLKRELALTRAYVNVQQIRMGERLRVEIDVPDELMAARLPSMTVLTLAENAVKHGLGPKREGGTLRIEARAHDGLLEVAVCDDGVGLRLGAGTGHGLANTRSRLTTAYGPRAALEIGNREGGGVRAALRLPFAPLVEWMAA